MAFYLQVLAGEAELAFSEMTAESPKIYFAADFDDPRTAPGDFLPNQRYRMKTHDGEILDNPVSFQSSCFLGWLQASKKKSRPGACLLEPDDTDLQKTFQ